MAFPPMSVTFENGTTVEVQAKPKDLARAEIGGHDFQTGGPIAGMYAAAWATLGRMSRAGDLPEGVEVPATLDAFLDLCDVEPAGAEDDDAGEGTGQEASSG